MMKYMRCFVVKYLGPTNYRGSRIRITDGHRSHSEETISVIIPFDYELSNTWEMAWNYLMSIGIECSVRGGTNKKDYLFSDNFDADLKKL